MNNQKGAVTLAVPLLLLLVIGAILFFLISQGLIKLPSKVIPTLPGKGKEATVSLQTQYQNPFDGKFVNPFSGYKNPFDALK